MVNALVDADAIVLMRDRTPFTAALLAGQPKLRHLVFTGTRNAKLDLAVLAARNIPVSCTEFGPSKDSTCELTWATLLAATKQLESHTARLRSCPWRKDTAAPLPGSLLVNTSRLELIDTAALVSALQKGRPGFAAHNVFDAEPLQPDDPLRGLPNVLLTPRLCFVTEPVFHRFATGGVDVGIRLAADVPAGLREQCVDGLSGPGLWCHAMPFVRAILWEGWAVRRAIEGWRGVAVSLTEPMSRPEADIQTISNKIGPFPSSDGHSSLCIH